MIAVKVDVTCSACGKSETLPEEEALHSSAWVKVKLEPVLKEREHYALSSRSKETCLCESCAAKMFPDLYPGEVRQGG